MCDLIGWLVPVTDPLQLMAMHHSPVTETDVDVRRVADRDGTCPVRLSGFEFTGGCVVETVV